jgi:O-antigen/teichoic acid export membrane protein
VGQLDFCCNLYGVRGSTIGLDPHKSEQTLRHAFYCLGQRDPIDQLNRTRLKQNSPSITVQTAWLLAARVAAFFMTLILPVTLVRIFDKEQIGIYRQIFLVVGTAISVLPMGFTTSAFYYLPRETKRRGLIVMNIVAYLTGIGMLCGGALALFPQILNRIVNSHALAPYAHWIGLTIFLWLFSGMLETIATANEDVRSSTVFIVFAQLSKTALILAAALIFRSIVALLYAAVLQGVVESLMLLWYLRKAFPRFWARFDFSVFREQTSYVAPLGLAGLAYTAQCDLHSYVVAEHFSTENYAVYSIGNSQLPLVSTVKDAVVSVLLARVSSLQQKGETEQIRTLMLRAVRKLSAMYIPVAICLFVLGREFIITVYTAKFIDSLPFLLLNALLLPLAGMTTDPVLRAYAAYRYVTLKVRLSMLVVLVVLALSSIHYFGMIGVMASYVLSVTTERLLLFRLTMKILHGTWADWKTVRDVWKYLASALASGLAVLALKIALPNSKPQLILVLGGALFFSIYISAIALSGAIDEDERRMIKSVTTRYLRLNVFRGAAA